MKFKIGRVKFDQNNVVVIAEAGVNHNNSLKIAKKLIRAAKNAGANIIKFQTYKAEKLVSRKAPRFWNWSGEVKQKGTQYDSYKRLDKFGFEEYRKLKKLCDKYEIEFMSTPFDNESADMLQKIGVKGFKVASCDITNYLLLKHLAKKKLPLLLSTGASNIKDISNALKIIKRNGNPPVCVMHCTLCYPTDPKDVNMFAIKDISKRFPNNLLGLSDHTLGNLFAPSSVLLGVRVIEKHFTINKKLKKSADHWLSVDEKELSQLVRNSKNILNSIGIEKKIKLNCENSTYKFARRSIVAKKYIKKGQIIREKDLICKRPGTGLPASKVFSIIGKRAKKIINEDEFLTSKDF